MNKILKIVHVMSNAPHAYPLPPTDQGGTEKVFYDLTEELVRHGHLVYVFAPENSTCSAQLIQYPSTLQEEKIGKFVSRHIPPHVDLINDFTFSSAVKRHKLRFPTVSTHQCPLGLFTSKSIYPSGMMKNTVGKRKGYVVYNGIRPNEYEYSEHKKDYLLFIGRLVREKGVLEAIRVAADTHHKLIIAGPVKDVKLFEEEIEPVLKNNPKIEYVGAVGGKRKQELFKNAKCVLFPVTWQEPFGLVMIEAMVTGTPVLAFNRGSIPEVLAGFPQLICQDIDEMTQKVRQSVFPAPMELRQYVTDRFSSEKMADHYIGIYERILEKKPKKAKRAKVVVTRRKRILGRKRSTRLKR